MSAADDELPAYLSRYYGWANLRPNAVRFFDRRWVHVARIQLDNLQRKLPGDLPVRLWRKNACRLGFFDGHVDKALLFFLLHEQPEDVRRATLAEAVRVMRPEGWVIVVDYHSPRRRNVVRYFMAAVLKMLEPFAMDLWRREVRDYLPATRRSMAISKRTFFADLYPIVSVEPESAACAAGWAESPGATP